MQVLRARALCLTVLLAATPWAIQAQTEPTPPESAPEPAPPCLRPELKQIAFLEGDWEVLSRKRTNFSEDRWEESRARATWTPILAGCVLEERWSGSLDGKPLEWIQLIAHDHRQKAWEQVLIDTAHGNVVEAEGRFDEGRLIFVTPQMRHGRLLIDRTTIAPESANRISWTFETSRDGGRTWIAYWTMVYSRR